MAELEAKRRHLPFLTAKARMTSRWGLSMSDDDFIEKGYYIWRDIGNIAVITKRKEAVVPSDLIITLPSDAEFIEAVKTAEFIDTGNHDGTYGTYANGPGGTYNEFRKSANSISAEATVRKSDFDVPGEQVNYSLVDGGIKVSSALMSGRGVYILYASVLTDDMGLPMLNDKEVEAISTNLALQDAEKRVFMGDPSAERLIQMLGTEPIRTLTAAKIPERINGQAIDRLLDVQTSMDRKTFGNAFNWGL